MDDLEVIVRCLETYWPNDFDMVGEDLARELAVDAIQHRGYQFEPASGGYNFDLTPYLTHLFAAANLLVSIIQIQQKIKEQSGSAEEYKKKLEELEDKTGKQEKSIQALAQALDELKQKSNSVGE